MKQPRLSLWQIWNMSFGFLGIQFGWGPQMANMSPIYKYLGAADAQIPMLWLAAPLTGSIVQPEILAALMFGPLVKNVLGGNLVHAVMAGGVFMLIAALLTQWVKPTPASAPANR